MSYIKHINSSFGIAGEGNCLIGPYCPHGLAKPGPDGPLPQNTNGLSLTGKPEVLCFSQNHVSGAGGQGRYGNISIMPFMNSPESTKDAVSCFSSVSRVGYYQAKLANGITHEITASPRVACHRSTFDSASPHGIVLNPLAAVKTWCENIQEISGFAEWSSSSSCQGWGIIAGGWGHIFPYQVYFFAEASSPFSKIMVLGNEKGKGEFWGEVGNNWGQGKDVRAIGFTDRPQIELRIGISFVSIAQAEKAVSELADHSFEEIEKQCCCAWDKVLGNIEIDASREEKDLFYSAYYRLLTMPTDLGKDENHLWESDIRNFTDYYCLWDSVRNANSFLMLIQPELQRDMLLDLIDIGNHIGWFPDAWSAGHSAKMQGGSSADVIFSEAARKGIAGVDYKRALEIMVYNAESVSENPVVKGRYPEYRKLGYNSSPEVPQAVSRHIEYAFQDYCIAKLAVFLGKKKTAQNYFKEADKLWNLWNDAKYCFAPRNKSGNWLKFDPWTVSKAPYYYEGTAHEWSLTPLHVLPELVHRHGGKKKFEEHLNRFFTNGLHMWKETVLHTPYLYYYADRPDLVAQEINQQRKRYSLAKDGLPDNEDMGSHSTFIMATSMGIYPIMGDVNYWLSPPRLREVLVKFSSGKELVIRNRACGSNKVSEVKFNGTPLKTWTITHTRLTEGGILEFHGP